MKKSILFSSFFCLCFFILLNFSFAAEDTIVKTYWGGSAESVYDTGFMKNLKKNPGGGVSLFKMDLIENDAPGSGHSEKGVYLDNIYDKYRAKKILRIEDPRAELAWLVIFPHYKSSKYPLKFAVNGHESELLNWDASKNVEWYRWSSFPAEWLKKGDNIIELYCPEAKTKEEGWEIFISRADEFEHGGGDPKDVGKTSFKSFDGGKSWKQSPFGEKQDIKAEYSVRLSLDRFVKTGWLESPVIDLWKGDSKDVLVPLREIQKLKLQIEADVPKGTRVEYFFRRGVNPQPFSPDWEAYRPVGEGANLSFDAVGADLNRRFVQFKAVLSTENPLESPVIKSVKLTADLLERVPLHKNIHVLSSENPDIQYSSINWEWEKWDRPEFKKIRDQENLDEVIDGSRTEFEAQVRLLDYVTKRWRHSTPFPEYPGWDAKSILDRIDNAGAGGMCIQFNNVLGGLCMAYGWQARLVNVVIHEVIEVWNDDYGKWIFMDADYENNYNYDPETDEPLNLLDIHKRYLDYYFPGRSIDWMTDMVKWMDPVEGKTIPVNRGSLTNHPIKVPYHKDGAMSGFINAAFMRVIPRNNFYEKPTPLPVSHGSGTNWPWDGYLNWYDDRTPPKRQYSWHTDRPRDMWPDLNKVHIHANSGFGNDRIFLRFETYTPNFSNFEINVDDTGWKTVDEKWTWLLQSGKNSIKVRAVSKLGARGYPSSLTLNYADARFQEYME